MDAAGPVCDRAGSVNLAPHAQTTYGNRQNASVLTLQQSTNPKCLVVRQILALILPVLTDLVLPHNRT